MNREQLNSNFIMVVSYYCGTHNIFVHNPDTDIMVCGYDSVYNIIISQWLLSQTLAEPSIELLLSYSLSAVLEFNKYAYDIPKLLTNTSVLNLNSTQISNLNNNNIGIGSMVYETATGVTLGALKIWNGSTWLPL